MSAKSSSEFMKFAVYEINIQKSIVCLNNSSKQLESKIKLVPFKIILKIWNSGKSGNTGANLYTENITQKIEDLNKWRDTLCAHYQNTQ